jgi:hypothetical protein
VAAPGRARIAHSEVDLLECAYERLRQVQIELRAERELQRLTNAALNGFFQDLYSLISSRLSVEVRTAIDHVLVSAISFPRFLTSQKHRFSEGNN